MDDITKEIEAVITSLKTRSDIDKKILVIARREGAPVSTIKSLERHIDITKQQIAVWKKVLKYRKEQNNDG